MNVIPTFLAILVNTKVSIDRIAQFLDEEEVPAFVSDLKEEPAEERADNASEQDKKLGIVNGWFRWNQALEPPEKDTKKNWWRLWKRSETPSIAVKPTSNEPNPSDNGGASTPAEAHRFELCDVNIIFPSGQLTLVTGPTGMFLSRSHLSSLTTP